MTDILLRTNLRDHYTEDHWTQLVQVSKHNLSNISIVISNQLEILQDRNFMNEISDNDSAVITKLGIAILSNTEPKIYMADRWELLADNYVLSNNNQNNNNNNQPLVNIKTLYTDEQWDKNVNMTRNMLMKVPPQKFIDTWPIIGNKIFRDRMILSENNSIIAVKIAMLLSKDQKIKDIYLTDDWELFINNLKIINNN